tara:strand:- start:2480 stop:3046 length:567 start_codon:yes stop_codon:yes gene_type:complete
MRLVGKKVERLNSYGDNLIISVKSAGVFKLSPALISRLGIAKSDNRVGFAYPENDSESLAIYKAVDGDGVAVNTQGYIKNVPHNRDVRSTLNLPTLGDHDVYVNELFETFNEFPDYKFFVIEGTDSEMPETEAVIADTIEIEVPTGAIEPNIVEDTTFENLPTEDTTSDTVESKVNEEKEDEDFDFFG